MKILLILTALILGISNSPAADKKNEDQKTIKADTSAKDQKTTTSVPVVINVTGGTQTINNTCHSKNCNKEPDRWLDKLRTDPVATFTGFLFLATLGLIGTGIIQYRAMKSQETSQHRIERAYIFAEVILEDFIISAMEGSEKWGKIRATVKFWNYGKTPAIVTMIRGYIDISTSIPQKLIESQDFERPLPPSLGISTNDSYWDTLSTKMSLEDFSDIKNLRKTVYFVGKMDYLDIHHKPQRTGYCWQVIYRDLGSSVTVTRDSQLNKRT